MCRMSRKSGSLNLLKPSGPHQACYGTTLTFVHKTGAFNSTPLLLCKILSCVNRCQSARLHPLEAYAQVPWLHTHITSTHHEPYKFSLKLLILFSPKLFLNYPSIYTQLSKGLFMSRVATEIKHTNLLLVICPVQLISLKFYL